MSTGSPAAARLGATPAVAISARGSEDALEGFRRALAALALATLIASVALALWGAVSARGLHADGAGYFVHILAYEGFALFEPPRRAISFLMQLPTVIAVRSGLVDLDGAVIVFGAGLSLLPIVLLALCYAVLPRGRKQFFFWPLLHYLALTLGTAASPLAEPPAATCYYWLTLFAIAFPPPRWPWLATAVALSLPAALLHEGLVLFTPVIAAAAAWRARGAPDRGSRAIFRVLAAWFVAVCGLQVGAIMFPRDLVNRDGLVTILVELRALLLPGGAVNMPALLGLVALAVVVLIALVERRRARSTTAWWIVAVLAAAGVLAAGYAATHAESISPRTQFLARYIPPLFSVPLAVAALASVALPVLERWWARRPLAGVCAVLAVAGFAWQALAIGHWARYVETLRPMLTRGGLVPRADVEAALSPRDRVIFRNMSWGWTLPSMSLVLSPAGRVSTIIANAPGAWQPWDPARPEQIPRGRFWTLEPYLRRLAEQNAEKDRR